MPQTPAGKVEVRVGVELDHASLRGQAAGSDTRYTVAVRGTADQDWADAYVEVQQALVPYRRFQLDRRTRTVSFSCPTVEGPAFVFEMLERLEELLVIAERRAGVRSSQAAPAAPSLRPLA